MASLNRVCLVGNLTSDPTKSTDVYGALICRFQLAVTSKVTNLRGQEVDETCVVDVEAGGDLATLIPRMFHKDSAIFVDGRLAYQSWTDEATRRRRSRNYVVAVTVQKAEPDGSAVPEPPPEDSFDQGVEIQLTRGENPPATAIQDLEDSPF